jgi:putative aldouronate transport system substrate-binding protein
MNKKNIKWGSLLLSALMLVSATGCNAGKANATTAGKTETKATETKEVAKEIKKPSKIVLMTALFDMSKENGQQKFLDKYKELTGIELQIIQPPHNQYSEKVNLAFASGDIPDVFLSPDYSSLIKFISEGAVYDITNLVEASKPMMTVNQKLLDGIRFKGRLYGFPQDLGNGCVTMLRQDWLTKLNLKVPTNYQEYLTMLRAFTFNDPDGNGKNDTKGFTAGGLEDITGAHLYLLDFLQDAVPNFQYKDGKWVDGFQEPEMVKALERISSAYKEGLIDKDIVTNKTTTARDKIINGEIGATGYWAGQWNLNLDTDAKKVNPNAKIVTIPALAEVTYINRVPGQDCITSASSNPEGVFKYFLEYAHDGAEGQTLFTQGVEGVNYKIENGKGVMLPLPADPTKKFSKTMLNPAIPSVPFKNTIFPVDPIVAESAKIFESKMVQADSLLVTDTSVKMSADIVRVRSTTFSKIMMGEVSIEKGLEEYKNKVNKELQMEKILNEMNAK